MVRYRLHLGLRNVLALMNAETSGAQLLVRWQERQFWERVARERATFAPTAHIYTRFARYEWHPMVRSTSTNDRRFYVRKVRSKGSNPLHVVEPQVDRFLDLFAKTRKADRTRFLGGVSLKPTPTQTRNVKDLNDTRIP